MDSSILYISVFVICLLLSWYLYKRFFAYSGLEDKFSDVVNSGGSFVFGLVLLLIILLLMLASNHFVLWFITSITFSIAPYFLVVIGSILFQFGFAKMNELEFMRNIPRSKIRSVAIGPVEISGTILSQNVLTTPYSKSPCVYCRSELEIYSADDDSDSDNSGGWKTVPGPTFKIPFWVKDETGQIMVDPEGAEVEISDRELGMLNQDGSSKDADDAVSENFSPRPGDRRYVEQFLAPNDPVFILGSAGIRKDGPTEQLLIQGGTETARFVISDSREKYAIYQEKWEMLAGLSYGIVIFVTGFLGILYLINLL
ncbi:MAG TPA: GIDE domain-containing protein [Candidatus Kryptonia bacterium]